jgi:hypothetical protein
VYFLLTPPPSAAPLKTAHESALHFYVPRRETLNITYFLSFEGEETRMGGEGSFVVFNIPNLLNNESIILIVFT